MSDIAIYLSIINDPNSTPLQREHAQNQINRARLEKIAQSSDSADDER